MRCSCTYLAVSFSLLSCNAFSSTIELSDKNFSYSFKEGSYFDVNVGATYGYIDNYLNQHEDEKSSTFTKMSANTFIQMHNDHHLLQLAGVVDSLSFNQFSEDDHSNVDIKVKYFFKLSDMQRLFSSAMFKNRFEYRGTGSSKGGALDLSSGDEFDDKLFNVGYNFGRFDSVSKASLLIGTTEREYKTRQHVTNTLNNEATFMQAGLDYLMSGKTYISFIAEYQNIEYESLKEQDRDELALLAGVKWETSDVSQLTFMLGYETLSFDENVFDDEDIFKWRMSYGWSPYDYLNIKLKSGRATEQSNELERNYRIVDDYILTSLYDVNPYVAMKFNVSYRSEEITFVSETRDESYLLLAPSVEYQVNDRILIHLAYNFTSVQSDIRLNEYDKSSVEIGINGLF